MKAVTTAQVRALDDRAVTAGHPVEQLMERAGYAVAHTAARLLKRRSGNSVLLVAGKGHNGGDAIVAARHLAAAGCQVTLVLVGRRHELAPATRYHFQNLIGVDVRDWPCDLPPPTVVVDGLLGTGLTGPVREPYATIIRALNQLSAPVLAIDVPSGLDSETGVAHGDCVRAAVTVTLALPKRGLLQPAAADYVGQLEVADIGIPPALLEELDSDVELLTGGDVAPLLPRRSRTAHKGDCGHLLILAGSEGYTGAPVLAAHAAARTGVGLVTLAVPRAIYPIVAGQCSPEIMPRPLDRLAAPAGFDAVAIGPGLGQDPDSTTLVVNFLQTNTRPAVVDADALNILAGHPVPVAGCVLTPHPGEMGRLIGKNATDVQADRWGIARRYAQQHQVTLVLKGAGTVVAASAGPLWVNATGNPGMAKGGMGDVLTGIIGGFLAQGLPPFDAARAGVFLHGSAGDLAAERHGTAAMLATDLIACLGDAFGRLD